MTYMQYQPVVAYPPGNAVSARHRPDRTDARLPTPTVL